MAFHFSPHIAVQVDDRDAAARFYETVLGMERVEGAQSEEDDIVLRKGPVTLYLEQGRRGTTFFEFRVDDIAEAEAALLRAGCSVTRVYSDKSKMIADPYGLQFHIHQE